MCQTSLQTNSTSYFVLNLGYTCIPDFENIKTCVLCHLINQAEIVGLEMADDISTE